VWLGQEAVAVAELEAGEDDAEPSLDFESEVDLEVDGLESDLDLSLEPGSDLPFELDSADSDWAELLERLSVR
jgi:hypothetical protein